MILLVDTWQHGGEIDESILTANGVSGIFIRINQSNGGLSLDSNFEAQWEQAKSMLVRVPYFVFNPAYASAAFDWLDAVVPSAARALAVDVEYRNPNISPSAYRSALDNLLALCKQKWNTMIYTGYGFSDLLSSWPTNEPYWWAQYPSEFYPPRPTAMSWESLKSRLSKYPAPLNADKVPGVLKCWQFTGDRLILPGCDEPMDVNLWLGSVDELLEFAGNGEGGDVGPGEDKTIVTRKYYDGMTYSLKTKNTAHGPVNYHVMKIENEKVEGYFVSPAPRTRAYVPDYLERHIDKMHFAINCDQWTNHPATGAIIMGGFNCSAGQPYGGDGEETIYISRNNSFSFERPASGDMWMAFSFPNRLVWNGEIVDINKPDSDIRARSAFGWNNDQSIFYFVWVDGGDYWSTEGMNFREVAGVMHELGCEFAVMLDGGNSTSAAVSDNGHISVLGEPSGEDYVPKWNANLRRVANVLGVKMKSGGAPNDNSEDNDMKKYKVVKAVGMRPVPTMDSSSTGNASAGTEFESDVFIEDVKFPGTFFVQMPNKLYVPLRWNGVDYVQEVLPQEPPQEPPAQEFPEYVFLELPSGERQKYTREA